MRRRTSGAPCVLLLALPGLAPGDRPTGQRLQRVGLRTKPLLCGSSSKISPLPGSLVAMATRKLLCRSGIKYCRSSPGHGHQEEPAMARPQDRHFYTRYPSEVPIGFVTPQMSPGLRLRPWPESHTAQAGVGPGHSNDGNWKAWTKPSSPCLILASQATNHSFRARYPVPTGSMLGVSMGIGLHPSMVVGLGNRHDHP